MNIECAKCHRKTVARLCKMCGLTDHQANHLHQATDSLLSNNQLKNNPVVAAQIQRMAKHLSGKNDLYIAEKEAANRLLLSQYAYYKSLVAESANPLLTAAKLAVCGNIIDYGAHSVSDNISAQIDSLMQQEIAIDKSKALFEAIDGAATILYLGDNCGEIVFDKLFLETLGFRNVVYAVRGAPVLNDATRSDAESIGMESLARIVENGHDAPSTILSNCSKQFNELFYSADVVVSKGQGNFEGLYQNTRDNLFFMLVAKCKPISELIGCNTGDLLITSGPF